MQQDFFVLYRGNRPGGFSQCLAEHEPAEGGQEGQSHPSLYQK